MASLLPVAAAAQGVGFQAGAAFDPKQIYVGSHIEFPLGSDQIVIRPGISGAFGAGWRMATIGGDFIYRFTLGGGTGSSRARLIDIDAGHVSTSKPGAQASAHIANCSR